MQHEDNLKCTKVEKNLTMAVSKKVFCQVIVLK